MGLLRKYKKLRSFPESKEVPVDFWKGGFHFWGKRIQASAAKGQSEVLFVSESPGRNKTQPFVQVNTVYLAFITELRVLFP